MNTDMFPDTVFTLWGAALVLTGLVFVPLTLYLLHALKRATSSIRGYGSESLVAARGIASNASAIPALDATIGAAGEIQVAAEAVGAKLDALATELEARTARGR